MDGIPTKSNEKCKHGQELIPHFVTVSISSTKGTIKKVQKLWWPKCKLDAISLINLLKIKKNQPAQMQMVTLFVKE